MGGLLVVAVVFVFLLPYRGLYANTWIDSRPLNQQGWGEALDAAAAYLNTNPLNDKQRLTIASWYPAITGTYFSGKTFSLSSLHDTRVGYVVLYRNMLGREGDDIGSNVWDEFRDKKPEKIISVGGVPYVWIFNTVGMRYFDRVVGEITDGVEIGQTVPVTVNNWQLLDIGLATYQGRQNSGNIILHIKDLPEATADIRTVSVPVSQVLDSEWHTFMFDPIADSAGKTYYVSLTSEGATPGTAITVKYVDKDILGGEIYIRRQALESGQTIEQFKKSGDMAYRIPQR